ncbi:hypothetical protein Ahia01_001075900 [Argonauta hians]
MQCSFPDFAQKGWQKWSATQPGWLAPRVTSQNPLWYSRKINNIRRANYKAINFQYDRPFKPTSRPHDNFISVSGEVMPKRGTSQPIPQYPYEGPWFTSYVNKVGQPQPHWGKYHPPSYSDAFKQLHLPNIFLGDKPYFPSIKTPKINSHLPYVT